MASSLFNLVAQAKAYAQRNVMARGAAQRLETTINEYAQGRRSKWQLEQALNDFGNIVGQQKLRDFEQSGGTGQFGVNDAAARALSYVTGSMGQIGQVIQGFFDRRTTGYQANQVQAAVQLLKATNLQDVYHNSPQLNHSITAAMEALEDHGWSVQDTMQTMQRQSTIDAPTAPGSKPPSPPGDVKLYPYYDDDMSPYQRAHKHYLKEDNLPRLSKKHFTPQSSNVFAFQYDFVTSTLYVQFKAPIINSTAVTNYRSAEKMRAMAGDLGKTVSGKTNDPGPLYAYYDVPNKIYKQLIAAQSAGKAVWDLLRVRGTIYGHQYRYALVAGVEVPGENGQPAFYVPRKATHRGYRSRSVAVPGMGPRRYVSSTLPQDLRGGTRGQGRPIRPSRGRPDPPNRGR